MALAGNIKEFGLADIFQIVSLQQKTGVLIVESSKGKVTILLESGFIVGGEHSERPIEEQVEQSLIRSQQISKFQLKRAVESQKKTLQPLWTVLAETGEISRGVLQKLLSQQIHETVYNVLRWSEGEYRFEPRKNVEYDKDLIAPINTEFLVMEGFRITDEWTEIEKEIPSLQVIIRRNPNASPSPEGLSPEETKVYQLLASERSVQDIIYSSQLGEFDTCQVIYALMEKHLVGRVEGRKGRAYKLRRGAAINLKNILSKGISLIVSVGILIAVIGVFIYLPDNFMLIHRPRLNAVEDVKNFASQAHLNTLSETISAYILQHEKPPSSLQELVQEEFVSSEEELQDLWGNPYMFTVEGKRAILRSSGKDGVFETEDDLQRVISF